MLYALYLLVIFALTGIDQLCKYYIVNRFTLNDSLIVIKDFFNITYINNYGAGFSILQDQRIFLCLVSIIAIGILVYLLITEKKNSNLTKASYLMIIAGALGNLIDRIRLGYVVDFLDFNIFGYDFPVFNFADCCITIGCFIVIFIVLKENKNANN